MLDAKTIKSANKSQRKSMILEAAARQTAPTTLGDLEKPYTIGKALNEFIEEYIEFEIHKDLDTGGNSVLIIDNLKQALNSRMSNYLLSAMTKMNVDTRTIEDMMADPKNAYELAGAKELAFANKVTRNLSTTMGSLWEKLADISPYALNPDLEFGIKIRGIDIICKNIETQKIEFIQLKTTKNTLSGSQSARANSELLLHQNPVFAAAFDVDRNWTYQNNPTIRRISGAEFWNQIGMDYPTVYNTVVTTIRQLEEQFVQTISQ